MAVKRESKILHFFSRPSAVIPILLFFIAISYVNTLYSPFVLDDIHSFIEEPYVYVHDFSYESFVKLSKTFFGPARIIPLATFSLNHYLAKGQMPIYHITNIIIHLLVTLIVYWFTKTLLRTRVGKKALRGIPAVYFCLFVAALWALNPVQTNAVTYIVQRMNSISTLFYLAALTFYVKGRLAAVVKSRVSNYLLSAAMTLCAFFSKENSYILPVAILLVEWVFISPEMIRKILVKMKWFHWVGIILLTVILLPIMEKIWVHYLYGYRVRPFNLTERLMTEARIVVHYISLLALPLPGRMNFDYDFPLSTSVVSPVTTLASFILLGVALIYAFQRRKYYPLISFGILWFFLNLLVESTVIPLELVFEHRLYLPSVGFYIAILSVLDLFVAFLKTRYAKVEVEQLFVLVMILAVCLLSIATSFRNNVWRDSYALYGDCVKKSPDKPRPHLNFGVAMGRDRNRERDSIKEFEKVIELSKPKKESYVQAANNIVVAYSNLGEYEKAVTVGEKYLKEAPDYVSGKGYPKMMSNMAFVYNKLGNYSESMRALATGMTKERRRLNGYLVNLMSATLTLAYDSEEYREKVELPEENGDKFMSVRLRMAKLLCDLRDYEKADDFIKPVVKMYPEKKEAVELYENIQENIAKDNRQEALMKLANHPPYETSMVYKLSLDLSDFILEYYPPLRFVVGWLLDKAAQASQPDDPFVLWYRIKWHMKTSNREKLITELEDAAERQPDFVPILRLAGDYYDLIGDKEKAVEIFSHILNTYPGEPLWLKYEKRIIAFNENKTVQ